MVLIVDDLLLGGFRFVLSRLAEAVDAERTDEKAYREELLAAQMRLELGEISEEEFATIEAECLARIREVKASGGVGMAADGTYRVEGVDVGFEAEAPAAGERAAVSSRRKHKR